MKKLYQISVVFALLLIMKLPAYANEVLKQTIQINTHFSYIVGMPAWLLIIRDVDTGRVSPFLFDIRNNDNFWLAFSSGRNYRVTASTLTFGHYAIINNFCRLEDGVLSGKSMAISLTGVLTPNSRDIHCHVRRYDDTIPFTVVNTNE